MDVVALTLIGLAAFVAIRSLVGLVTTLAEREAPDELIGSDIEARQLDDLAVRKTALVAAIRTTELDFETGKISDRDRDRTLRRLEQEAVVVMRTMDEIRGGEGDRDAAEQEIVAFLSQRLGSGGEDESWSAAARLRHGGRARVTSEANS